MLVDRDGRDPEDAFLLDRALMGAGRMSNLIQDLIDFATLGGGRAPEPVDLGAVAADAVEDLAGVTDGAVIEVGALPTVLGNESQLRSVMQNLLANAVKFTAPIARPHICVDAVVNPASARVRVTDNGPGVAPGERDRIFERLARGTDEVEGHGIGLATCARIIAAHGGTIGVEDAPGGGSRFWFELSRVAG